MRLHRAPRSGFAAVVAVGLLFILTSCGASSEPSQTSPAATTAASPAATPTTATPTAACADVAALKSSLDALTQVRLTEDGVKALTTAIKTNLDKAEASASPALQPAVQQVKAAFAELQTAAGGMTAGNLRQKAPAIAAAMKQVAAATQALRSTLTESCPGS